MNEFERVAGSQAGRELVDLRTDNSKTFDLSEGRRILVQTPSLVHFRKAGAWVEIDLSPVEVGGYWRPRAVAYDLEVNCDRPRATYRAGTLCVELEAVGDHVGPLQVDQYSYRWLVGTDRIAVIQVMPEGIRTETWLLSPKAHGAEAWRYVGAKPQPLRGLDASECPVEIIDGAFTGRVSTLVSRKTRRREWRRAAAYPVRLF